MAYYGCRSIRDKEDDSDSKSEERLGELCIKRSGLAEALSKLEVESREILLELLAEFDRRYSDIAEVDRGLYTTYFATVGVPVATVHAPVAPVHVPVATVHAPVATVHAPVAPVHAPVAPVHVPVATVHVPVGVTM